MGWVGVMSERTTCSKSVDDTMVFGRECGRWARAAVWMGCCVPLLMSAVALRAQAPPAPATPAPAAQAPSGGASAVGTFNPPKMAFDVTSVKQNKTDAQPDMNFPMGPGDMYGKTGGRYSAKGLPLVFYIQFAYKMPDYQVFDVAKQLPDWAKNDRFDIEAKAEGEPAKDQMRAMMISLLAERFGLVVHHEMRESPVYALEPVKPGVLGPHLKLHPANEPCSNAISRPADPTAATPPPQPVDAPWPETCGGLAGRHVADGSRPHSRRCTQRIHEADGRPDAGHGQSGSRRG